MFICSRTWTHTLFKSHSNVIRETQTLTHTLCTWTNIELNASLSTMNKVFSRLYYINVLLFVCPIEYEMTNAVWISFVLLFRLWWYLDFPENIFQQKLKLRTHWNNHIIFKLWCRSISVFFQQHWFCDDDKCSFSNQYIMRVWWIYFLGMASVHCLNACISETLRVWMNFQKLYKELSWMVGIGIVIWWV